MDRDTVRIFAAATNRIVCVGFGALSGFAGRVFGMSPQENVEMALFGVVVGLIGCVNIVFIVVVLRTTGRVCNALRLISILINTALAGFVAHGFTRGADIELVFSL